MHVSISLNGIFWQFWSEDDAIKMSMSARGWTLRLRKYYMCTHADIYIYCSKILKKCNLEIRKKKHFPTETNHIQKYLSIWNLFLTFIETFWINNVFNISSWPFEIFLKIVEPWGPNGVWNFFFKKCCY